MFLVCLGVFLVAAVNGQQEGEHCVEQYTNTAGRCTKVQDCHSAKNDFEKSGINPTFCTYNTFGSALVCCLDGSSILQAAFIPNEWVSASCVLQSTHVRWSMQITLTGRPVWASAAPKDSRRVSERKCEEYSRAVIQKVEFIALVPEPEELSISAAKCEYNSIELIVGGEKANVGEFPHMAAIGWADFGGGYKFSCGGSLISPRFVLTAGHCIRDPNAENPVPVIVRLGDQNIDNRVNDGADPIDVPINRIHKHPEYHPPRVYNDIALLELAAEVPFKSAIRAACLWNNPDFGGYDKVIATGWGVVDTTTKETSNELQKVSLSLIDSDHCDVLLTNIRNRHWQGIVDSQVCAGELRGGKDTCQGDSGSPLQVVSKENHCIYHIVGVTSFGRNCAESGRPAIYTRISSYLDWIEGVVWPGE